MRRWMMGTWPLRRYKRAGMRVSYRRTCATCACACACTCQHVMCMCMHVHACACACEYVAYMHMLVLCVHMAARPHLHMRTVLSLTHKHSLSALRKAGGAVYTHIICAIEPSIGLSSINHVADLSICMHMHMWSDFAVYRRTKRTCQRRQLLVRVRSRQFKSLNLLTTHRPYCHPYSQ